ncbi:MAG: glycosyltransferase [Bacteroidetes bacterium]|nr:MAG: glycosyltransferase [Bacteroidota bacterium]
MIKPKVLILGKLPPPYMGPAIATEIILNSSLKNKFDLLHLDTKANKSLNTLGKWSLSKVFRNIGIYFRMLRILSAKKPSLVLIPISQSSTGYLKDFFFIALARLCGRKVLVQLRGSNFRNWLNSTSSLMRNFVYWSLRRSQGVIVLGHNLKPLFQGIFDDKSIYVVPNGGNYDLAFSVKQNDIPRILYLGNLQASKGIEDVLLATEILWEKHNGMFRVDVVGNWRSEETRLRCMNIVDKNKLPISFHPPASGKDKLNFLAAADVFVFTPRLPEGHPWVIVEAMAAGLPIVSTDRGAIVESVHDSVNGFIVNAEDPASIADRLEKLLLNKELRENMGRASRKMYEENFTEDRMVQRLAETFEAVIAGRK